MKRLAILLLAAAVLAATPAAAQTIKSLGYNTTNGEVVYAGTNALTFTNALSFGTNAATTRTNLGIPLAALTETNNANFRTAIGLGDWATLSDGSALRSENLTISDGEQLDYIQFTAGSGVSFFGNRASQFRSALGLGLPALTNTNNANFLNAVLGAETNGYGQPLVYNEEEGWIKQQLQYTAISDWYDAVVNGALDTDPEGVRIVLGLPLPALTQTSNVTMMRALAGSTNTNEPFSGSISVVGTNNTNTLVFSNGILLSQ